MPNPNKTPGQKLVEEWWNSTPNAIDGVGPMALENLKARIDRLIAELTPKRVLDLSRIDVRLWRDTLQCTFEHVIDAIRQQLPDVEVKT